MPDRTFSALLQPWSQQARALRLRLPQSHAALQDALLIQQVTGRETLCGATEVEVLCLSPREDLPLKEFMAVPAEIQLVTDQGLLRTICGFIAEVHAGQIDGELSSYRLLLRDALSLMGQRINTRVFLHASEADVTQILISEWRQRSPLLASSMEVDWSLLGERYLNNTSDWWKLVREDLIDPAGREDRERAEREGKVFVRADLESSDFEKYAKNMKFARRFHQLIEDNYHANTYAYFAADPQQPAWNEISWKCGPLVPGDPIKARLAEDDLNGTLELRFGENQLYFFKLQGRTGAGDGTVPAESGGAPKPYVIQLFKHEGKLKSNESYDHQFSFNAKLAQAVIGQRGMAEEMESFLGEGDPYRNIYLNNSADWWKLIREDLIDPAGREDSKHAKKDGKVTVAKTRPAPDFDRYARTLKIARSFHKQIEDRYHPNTYAYYAADGQQLAWNEINWKCKPMVPGDPTKAQLVADDLNGMVELRFGGEDNRYCILQDGTGPGDGTVPAESGAAPKPFVVQLFKHEGKLRSHESYDHQFSYNAAISQAVTLYSIVRIVNSSGLLRKS
ncbi:hypothetical protein J2X56_004903 [Herbaspirillum sp. 1173]|uniref:contractile injection system protein, VgrG/Pvc8 family n=1 Tax=Herbaspirillum sp. 1173 TaxID=2817734 RepID=UPI0028630B20|nr:contractile injection system protein, VgrG/Pvc8 family [Herbaspirillum sp. 1173]MDR6742868.1 hypothetical protein [Herbaspirillum sp. 1173]